MEHAQRVFVKRIYKIIFLLCLNPYFNGTCSKSKAQLVDIILRKGS